MIVETIPVKRGKRVVGTRYRLESGKQVFLAHRANHEHFRAGRKTVAEACRDGVAAWALDYEDVIRERTLGTAYLGILVKGTGEVWLTHLRIFEDRTCFKTMNFTGRGGGVQRYVLHAKFVKRAGVIKKL